ncbi:hypothetical protein, partial [Streptomyces sp. SID3212]|uniref:hypothetical protein n=1 Tax=Streptomyces sp. SID3212 TaxID=2690259 RepID=UPI001F366A45
GHHSADGRRAGAGPRPAGDGVATEQLTLPRGGSGARRCRSGVELGWAVSFVQGVSAGVRGNPGWRTADRGR